MILVTGATGLLGSYLTKLLLTKGERVRALKRHTSDLTLLGAAASQVEWVEGDLLDITSLETAMCGVQKVYHCAAVISFITSETPYMMQVNVTGTANVMNAALQAGVERVMHVSSEAAFGFPRTDKMIDETYADPHIHRCPWYYRSKHYGEREAWRAHAEGLDVVMVCPATILGGGWWHHAPNLLFQQVDRGLRFYTTATNGFVDVRDAAECMYRLMESPVSGEKFLLLSENASLRDVVWMIADALNKKRPFVPVGKWLIHTAWPVQAIQSWLTGRPPVITRQSAVLAEIDFCYSNQKITEALGYSFRPLRQTIEETAALYLHSIAGGKNYGEFK